MKFWDSSAVIPLLVTETESGTVKKLLQDDPEMIVWALTITEIHSSLYRKVREGGLSETTLSAALSRLNHLQGGWSEVFQLETTRKKAHRLLAVHPLRAADALQLAAGLMAFDNSPEGADFVTYDHTLALAAKKEGFNVIP